MARHVMTPRRRAALRKAQLASAKKRHAMAMRSSAKRKSQTRTTYHGGLTYQTRTTKGVVMRHKRTHMTKAYKGKHLVGYAMSTSGKKKATIEDLYVAKSHRGTGVSRKLLQHQAHSTRGKKIQVTGMRSIGGDKTASRVKIRGVQPTVKRNTHAPGYVTGIMETAWTMQSHGHAGAHRRATMRAHKNRIRGRKIQAARKRGR